jgi:hypothetical protein
MNVGFSFYRADVWEKELADEHTLLQWFGSVVELGTPRSLGSFVLTPPEVANTRTTRADQQSGASGHQFCDVVGGLPTAFRVDAGVVAHEGSRVVAESLGHFVDTVPVVEQA